MWFFEVSLTQDDDLFNVIHILCGPMKFTILSSGSMSVTGREAKSKQGPVNMSSYK